ncbi:hypothetical protein [Eoetvoesiella caeni]|uniref:Outer membrane protein with glycine zipper n=1 Tax=Eoetvoesiella caeni TaxID=645616 RepID=A0A366HAI6_9BURK|nr:hypothetical protein [Eoetvoesiella caeni]MCI2809333.1 hypothetical protein [Eoetvoesiella caeni]NYT54473.1 hypothetical protein [Eoetvoesiella caeni]RBP39340.1 hypothetical protein DFR37_105133 [Eoetvoesiella caeni]
MALIVAARFNTFDAAEVAAGQLMAAGVKADNLFTFFVNPTESHSHHPATGTRASKRGFVGAWLGAAVIGLVGACAGAIIGFIFGSTTTGVLGGAGVGAYVGSLAGALRMIDRPRSEPRSEQTTAKPRDGRPSGVVLAVHVDAEHELQIARMLRDAGGQEIERAQGRWENGTWRDFDPLESPEIEKNL